VERWEAEFTALDFPPDVVDRIILKNAMSVLGVEP
jgi:hypothetical protein